MHARREATLAVVAERPHPLPPVSAGVIDPEGEILTREAATRNPIDALMREAQPRFDAILAVVRRRAE